MEIVGMVLIGIGALLLIIGSLGLIIQAFKESVLWGLAYLFIPFASLVFLFAHWERAKKPFLIALSGIISIVLAGAVSPALKDNYDSMADSIGEEMVEEGEESGGEQGEGMEGEEGEPKSRLGKIMATAKKNLAKAEERSAEGSKVVEETGWKAAAKSKADAAVTADPANKASPTTTTQTASPPKPKTAATASGSYARAPVNLRVVSIIAGGKRKTAMINDGVKNHMIVVGENVTLSVGGGTKGAEVVAIQANAVIIKLDGRAAPMAIHQAKEK